MGVCCPDSIQQTILTTQPPPATTTAPTTLTTAPTLAVTTVSTAQTTTAAPKQGTVHILWYFKSTLWNALTS